MMLRVLTVLLVGAGFSRPVSAQLLTNKGAHIVVQPGATLLVRGSMVNSQGATLHNAGTLQLANDFTNAGAILSPGAVLFNGTTDQTLISAEASFSRLEVRNTGIAGQNRLLVPQSVSVSQVLQLSQGLIRTAPGASITLLQGALVQGEGPGRYVQGNLRVVRDNVTGLTDFGNGLLLNPNNSVLGTVTALRTAGLATAGTSYSTNTGTPARSIDRIWSLTSTQAAATPVSLTFSWTADDDNGLNQFNLSQVWQQAPDASWGTTMPATDASMRSITTTATPATFSRWTVSNAANPLPVELVSFVAKRQGDGTLLRWTTASELQNDYFDVESSADGRRFHRIGRQPGQGSSVHGATYELRDPNIARYASDIVYYRLRQVDKDKTETISPVQVVAADQVSALTLQAFPNPFAGALTVQIAMPQPGQSTLELRDAQGRLVWQKQMALAAGISTYTMPAADQLLPGLYLLTISQGAQRRHLSLTRQ